MYTNDLSKSNQLACSFFDLERLLHMMNMFIGQSEMVFFRFFQRLVILGAVPKGS